MFETLDRSVAAVNAASTEVLREVGRLDGERVWRRDGATSMTPWLAARYGLAWGTAREWVRVAHAIRSLPQITRAYADGRISWDQLRPLTRFATPETDADYARHAPSRTPAGLWREARRHERQARTDAEEAHRARYLSLTSNEGKTELYVDGLLSGEQGALLERSVEQRAELLVLADDPIDRGGARMADALVELVTEGGRGEVAPPTLVVHTEAALLTREERNRGPWLSETEQGTRLCSDAVRRIACDAKIEWMLESEERPVGLGRRGRLVRGATGRALRFRDQGCRFPGCGRTKWLKAHHLVHWAKGGATDLDNLVLLCHAHHRLVHEGGWRTSGHPGGDLRFHDPTGRALRSYAACGRATAVSSAPALVRLPV